MIGISAKKVMKILISLMIILIILSVLSQIYRYEFNGGKDNPLSRPFNVDLENNFPTYFQAFNLAFASVLLYLVFIHKRQIKDNYKYKWIVLSVIFFSLSIDEICSFHDNFSRLQTIFNTDGIRYQTLAKWIIPIIIIIPVLIIYFKDFIKDLPVKYKKFFMLAGLIYLTGVMGIELVNSNIVSSFDPGPIPYTLECSLEELFEMSGIILFIYSLMLYLGTLPEYKIKFDE